MAADPKVVVNLAAEFTGKKAFKQADTATKKLSQSVKRLGAAFGVTLGLQGARGAVKAFAADNKAAKILSKTLDNLGLAFADPAVKTFIADLEKQYGVVDDKLRPAYQKLLTTTGDWRKSQDLLKTALDLSAMSGVDVVSVTDDLSRAYAGNTRGLMKYGSGLSKADLAAMSFDEILAQIAKVSSGQAQTAADSLAGSLDKLSVAGQNASESIGKDLVNALTTLGGSGGLPKTLGLIESLSSGIGDALIGAARLAQTLVILGSGNPFESFKDLAKARKEWAIADSIEAGNNFGAASGMGNLIKGKANAAAELAAEKKRQKELLALAKANAAAELAKVKAKKDQLALDKAAIALGKGKDVFDLEAIQLNAAMISSTEALGKSTSQAQLLAVTNDLARLRVKEDMLALEAAIASGDAAAATAAARKLNTDLAILGTLNNQAIKLSDIKGILAQIAPKSLIDISNLDSAIAKIKEMLALQGTKTIVTPNTATPVITLPPSLSTPGFIGSSKDEKDLIDVMTTVLMNGLGGVKDMSNYATSTPTILNFNAPIYTVSDQEFAANVQKAIQNANRFGNNLDYAGGLGN